MAQELTRHGFVISYGTVYPMFHRMHKAGLLNCREQRDGSQARKYYMATPQGMQELEHVQHLIRELYQEVIEEAPGRDLSESFVPTSLGGEDIC